MSVHEDISKTVKSKPANEVVDS